MKKALKLFLIVGLLCIVALTLGACQSPAATTAPEAPKATDAPAAPQPTAEAPAAPQPTVAAPAAEAPAADTVTIPFMEAWLASGHAKADSEAFRHWDDADPKEIPVYCAKCHSAGGFADFMGADGSAAGVVDKAAALGSVIDCATCHNDATVGIDSIVVTSGAELKGVGSDAVCLACHTGEASMVDVTEAIEKAALADEDSVSADLGFVNPHYAAAGITKYGSLAMGGYQYEGKAYDTKFDHVAGFDSCISCHDQHSLEVKVDSCKTCHTGVTDIESTKNIRMEGSLVDYDGDGDTEEGLASEIVGLQETLYAAIQAYTKDVTKAPIAYSPDAYPYFFNDTNANGTTEKEEAAFPNKYVSFTPRLVKAAYNYQLSVKEPGAYAHGGKYMIQLLTDSIASLNEKLPTPVDISNVSRESAGHFFGGSEAFRHWDEEGSVPGSCARCHSASGLPTFIANGVNVAAPASNGFACTTCHDDMTTFTRFQVETVPFPSGAKVAFEGKPDANLCLNCHQGRESTVSVNKAIGQLGNDEVSDKLAFKNVHYFAAGASLFGTEVKGAYEFEGKEYLGKFNHDGNLTTCIDCHDGHELKVKTAACSGCHQTEDLAAIRFATDTTDWDGDGDVKEGVAGEIATMQEKLYAAILVYAKDTAKTPIVYSATRYPYFLIDANADGKADDGDKDKYVSWTPNLLRSAYNFQYVNKDPGSFAHNAKYIMQVLYDSIESLDKAAVTGMTRP